MTLAQLIAEVGELRPHQYGTDHMTAWVNEIEARAVREVINRACGNDVEWTPYTYDQDADKTLQIPDEHKAVYETYLFRNGNKLAGAYYSSRSISHTGKSFETSELVIHVVLGLKIEEDGIILNRASYHVLDFKDVLIS